MRSLLWAALFLICAAQGALSDDADISDQRSLPIFVLNIEAATGVGTVRIELYPDLAPRNVARILTLNAREAYADVAFHRVISGFMAQTGDVEFGQMSKYDRKNIGTGRSDLPDLPAELSDVTFRRGVVAMARGEELDSANAQFFIMTSWQSRLDGKYTVIGKVIEGMEVIQTLNTGLPQLNGIVASPDRIISTSVE